MIKVNPFISNRFIESVQYTFISHASTGINGNSCTVNVRFGTLSLCPTELANAA